MSISVTQWMENLGRLLDAAPSLEHLSTEPDGTLVDLVTATERAKARLAAVQARAETVFHESQVREQKRLGVRRDELGRGVADQIALARRITPTQASNEHALRRILIGSMPRTSALLDAGDISEWAAHKVAENVVVLDEEDRATLDAEFAERLPHVTAARAGDLTRARAMELDPGAALRRHRRAVSGRRVTLRPAVDGMSVLRAVLPVKEGVASFAALTRTAKAAKSSGDPRGKGQIMADTLVERTTGVETVDDIPVEIQLLMTDTTLLGDGTETAWIDGHPLPGGVARTIALGARTAPRRPPESELERELDAAPEPAPEPEPELDAAPGLDSEPATAPERELDSDLEPGPDSLPGPVSERGPESPRRAPDEPPPSDVTDAARWIRRLYADGRTGELAEVDPRRRLFRGAVRRFILMRDQRCRTPFCDAAIHDVDHAHRHADGGRTCVHNGVGHCRRFNLVKEMPGWSSTLEPATDGTPGRLTIETPTGHRYTSTSPLLRRLLDGPEGERAQIIPDEPADGEHESADEDRPDAPAPPAADSG